MRICHVIESAAGGSAAILVSLAADAVRRGHDVSVVYSPDRADPKVLAALESTKIENLVPSRMRRSVGPWDVADGVELRRTLGRLGRFDVIHSHSSKAGALARTFARSRRTAQIYSPHGFYTMTGEAPFYIGPVERALSHLSDRIIAVSDFERRHALDLGIAARSLTVVPNGIAPYDPLPADQARAELGLDPDAFVIGFVGRLAEQKNPVDAVAVAAATPDALLAIIGDGELRNAVEQAARKLGDRIRFCGSREAKPLYSAFDCLVCTSRYEGMPVAFLEALNCGVPILSYPVGSTEELVRNGETGFVTEPYPEAAAAAAKRILQLDAAQRRSMSEACRAVAGRHSEEEMGRRTIEVYQSALGGLA